MLDVIHYFFDQDNNYQTAEQAEAQSMIRRSVFKEWYGKEYKYGVPEKKNDFGEQSFVATDFDETTPDTDVTPVDPFKKARGEGQIKTFIPATDFDASSSKPFGSTLDAPLG